MEQLKKEISFITIQELNNSRILYEMKLPNIIRDLYIFIVLVIFICISYILIAPYNVTVTGKTIIKPENNVTYITPISNGILVKKNFKNGDYVHKNQLLYCLENEHIQTQILNYETNLNVNTKELNIINSVLAFIKSFTLDTFSFDVKYENESLQQISAELNKLVIEYNNSKNLYEQENNLFPAYTSKNSVEEKKKEYTIAKLNLSSFLANTKKEYEELKIEKIRTSDELNSTIKNLKYQLSITMITSPIEGYIEEIQTITTGECILSENKIAKIIPNNNKNLRAFIEIDSNDIAELQIDMPFHLTFPKYPVSEFLKIKGTIKELPNDSLFDVYGVPNIK